MHARHVLLLRDCTFGRQELLWDVYGKPADEIALQDSFYDVCLDRLVENGVAFTRAYTQCPICTPSRATFLTGRYPATHHVHRNGTDCFPANEVLVTKLLAQAGYDCGLAGKLHLSRAKTPAYPDVEFINILAPGVSKGKALEKLAVHLKVPLSQIMALGDGTNDVSLLITAGLGVAMGNAADEVKAVADYVTLDVGHSGLATALEKFL